MSRLLYAVPLKQLPPVRLCDACHCEVTQMDTTLASCGQGCGRSVCGFCLRDGYCPSCAAKEAAPLSPAAAWLFAVLGGAVLWLALWLAWGWLIGG